MAKVTGPLFSIDASGQFASSMIFSKWKGLNTARRYARPGDRNTERQEKVRALFTEAALLYQQLNGRDKSAWNQQALGRPMSGYNLFIKTVTEALRGETIEYNLIHSLETERINSTSAEFSVELFEPTDLEVRWGERGRAFNEILTVPEASFQDNRVVFKLEDLRPARDYGFRINAMPIYTTNTFFSNIEYVGDGSTRPYGLIMALITACGVKVMNTGIQHSTHGPVEMNDDNYLIIEWEPVPGAAEYIIYHHDWQQEVVYKVGRTSSTHLVYNRQEADMIQDIDDIEEWYAHEPKEFPLSSGQSGSYLFTTRR